jgi:cytochrome c biogenesis protein
MAKSKHPVWRFFASVKLALITLIVLASTSIIGTLIQQGEVPSYYVREYGPNVARLFETLAITNMYSSWWFVTLLCLFATNLVVCTIERLPRVWRLVTLDNLHINPQQLERTRFTHHMDTSQSALAAADRISQIMGRAGWRNQRRLDDGKGSILLFSQQGAWTRLGVYIVHLSILVILTGSIIGALFGFKAYVFLSEGRTTDKVFLQENREPIPLGFEVQCDRFENTYYSNGMLKQYRVYLTIFDSERKTSYQKSIIVNDPLTYRGITFYAVDSYPADEFFVVIRNRTTNMEQAFRLSSEREVVWPGTTVSFRIEELKRDQEGAVLQARFRFATDAAGEPSFFWMHDRETVTIQQSGQEFSISFRQLYSNLLRVTKDPGVPIVYFGCILILVGLAISYFLYHRRVWVTIAPKGEQEARILVSGSTNKHKPAFEQRFNDVVSKMKQDLAIPAENN